MSALTLIIFALVGYWVYYSVKHEGIFWIPRTATVLGSCVFFIWMTFKIQTQVNPAWFAFFVNMSSFAILILIIIKIVNFFQNKIEERVGVDPYKTSVGKH